MKFQDMKESDVRVESLSKLPCIVPFNLLLFREICGDKDLFEFGFPALLFCYEDGYRGMPQNLIGHVADKKSLDR